MRFRLPESLLLAGVLVRSAISQDCAAAAQSWSEFLYLYPDADRVFIGAEAAYDCVSSIPLQKSHSIRLLDSLRTWLEIDSQLDYLKHPEDGYLWDAVDITAELERIKTNVNNDNYDGQYDLEVELTALGLYFHDFHTIVRPGISSTVFWDRGEPAYLISASSDGLETPKVYLASDLIESDEAFNFYLKDYNDISPVATINGLDVQEFLQIQQLVAYSHDPDAMYNQLFLSVAQTTNPSSPDLQDSTFKSPVFYPGPMTEIVFQNGTPYSWVNLAFTTCDLTNIITGQEYWDTCVMPPEEEAAAASSTLASYIEEPTPYSTAALATTEAVATETAAPVITQIPSHPEPVAIDIEGILSGYYLDDADYADMAVLVIRGFQGASDAYLESFQETLELFLDQSKADGKTKLVIDLQGNGGGYIDAGTELVAQLFPNVPPDQKGNLRASVGMEVILEKLGSLFDLHNSVTGGDSNTTIELINESLDDFMWFSWQTLMTPDTVEFPSFAEFFGPVMLGEDGGYTNFFQTNYTNTEPTELGQDKIQITGYGERELPQDTSPPFDPKNIVMLSDGYCGSTCSIIFEILTNTHAIPAVTVGGRPINFPMQTVGNSKGSQVFTARTLGYFYDIYANDTLYSANRDKAKGTIFEDWDDFAVYHGLRRVNAKNNYRIDDASETVLQMVYGASDCKMWYTPEMIVDPTAVWKKTASIAFGAEPFNSEYCVSGSTGHSSSVTGGLKTGELGDQNVPEGSKPQYLGWLKDGVKIVKGFSPVTAYDTSEWSSLDDFESTSKGAVKEEADGQGAVTNLHSFCTGYTGRGWLIKLICGTVG